MHLLTQNGPHSATYLVASRIVDIDYDGTKYLANEISPDGLVGVLLAEGATLLLALEGAQQALSPGVIAV